MMHQSVAYGGASERLRDQKKGGVQISTSSRIFRTWRFFFGPFLGVFFLITDGSSKKWQAIQL